MGTSGGVDTSGLSLISDQTLGADTASISFSSIPATYKHLLLLVQARSDAVATHTGLSMQFNGDTGANYDQQYLQSDNTTNTGARVTAQTALRAGIISAANAAANAASANRIDIPNYAGTTFLKHFVAQSSDSIATATPLLEMESGYWRSTAAITSILLFPASGNFKTGSRATLFGLV